MSRAIDAAIDGRPDALGSELARLEEAGVSPIPVLRQLVRRLMTLAELQAGDRLPARDPGTVIERVFFRERASTGRALRTWSAPKISEAIQRARLAERAIMSSANGRDGAGPVGDRGGGADGGAAALSRIRGRCFSQFG